MACTARPLRMAAHNAAYQQQGSMPAQHAAPTAQQVAANAVTEKADAPTAADALM